MKFKLLAYTFLIPLLLVAVLVLKIGVPDFVVSRTFSIPVVIVLLTGSLIVRLLSNDKYLTHVLVDNDKLRLTYLTPLVQQRQIIISLSNLTDIRLKKKVFLFRDFGSIKFFSKDSQITFYLMNDDTKQAARQVKQTFSGK